MRRIWMEIQKMFTGYEFKWSDKAIIMNRVHKNVKHIVNFITIITKQFIFQQKCLQVIPWYGNLHREIAFYCKLEFTNCKTNEPAMKRFQRRWNPVLSFFSSRSVLTCKYYHA